MPAPAVNSKVAAACDSPCSSPHLCLPIGIIDCLTCCWWHRNSLACRGGQQEAPSVQDICRAQASALHGRSSCTSQASQSSPPLLLRGVLLPPPLPPPPRSCRCSRIRRVLNHSTTFSRGRRCRSHRLAIVSSLGHCRGGEEAQRAARAGGAPGGAEPPASERAAVSCREAGCSTTRGEVVSLSVPASEAVCAALPS